MRTFDEYKALVNEHLTDFLPPAGGEAAVLKESMEYSLSIGGKRLRPVLLLASCEFAGGKAEDALPFAASLEYIHTYSLIHDDLPAMDDDDLRRGKPSNHKVFGEGMAVLAGDGLLNTAAEVMTGEVACCTDPEIMKRRALAAHEILSRAGARGMIAGQTADIRGEAEGADAELVRFIEEHKTADLIIAPVRAGLMLGGADDELIEQMTEYAEGIGIAFQVLDDILDYEGDPELLGKETGRDQELGKCSYACVHGLDAAHDELERLTSDAKATLAKTGRDTEFFAGLADKLAVRKY